MSCDYCHRPLGFLLLGLLSADAFGYAAAMEQGQLPGKEFMVSLKIF